MTQQRRSLIICRGWDRKEKEMMYESVLTPEEATARMVRGNATIYNKKTGIILIPDLVDGDGRENESCGFRAGNGDWMYGMMGAIVPPDVAKPIIAAEESLDDYALGHYPAPGTGAKDRMMQLSADSAEEVKEMFLDFFAKAPEGWISETVFAL